MPIVRDAALRLREDLHAVNETPDETTRNTVHAAMDRCLETLASTGVWGPDNRLPSSTLWQVTSELLAQGSLQLHARQKPYGYSGDHEMLYRICQDDRRGKGLAWAFDDYFQCQSAPCAVRNRARLIADRIVEGVRGRSTDRLKLVSVGSGPAEDIWLAQRQLEPDECRRLEVHLLDMDPRALAFCEQRLTEDRYKRWGDVRTHRCNLKRLNRSSDAREVLHGADLIVCPGFFDYLEHEEVTMMLALFFGHLRSSGTLYAFNFAVGNPSRAYMEWIGNWYLVYRTTDELQAARDEAGIPDSSETIGCEAENVNLYIEAVKG